MLDHDVPGDPMRPSALAPAAALALLALTACGDARRLATGEGGGLHGLGWADPAAHGAAARRDLAACKGCHGTALTGALHVDSCDACHTGGTAWRTNCTFCHGTTGRGTATGANPVAAAPPRGTLDETLPSQPAVGAHQAHLAGTGDSVPVACGACHQVPTDLSHVDGVRQVIFSGLAVQGGATPTYAAGGSCSATYCHGSQAGATQPSPSWTGGALSCTACHGVPPPTAGHLYASHAPYMRNGCANCHGPGYSASVANPSTHVDGIRTVVGDGVFVWDPAARTCSTVGCHSLPPSTRHW
jgi:predicted CxxxxCH...CXXCH cytochrome family protein